MKISNFCVYRYIDKETGKILYVGKTDVNLINRIRQHSTEKKFKEIDANIEYIELKNRMETRFYEFYFINKWKPELNILDKYDDLLEIELGGNIVWKPFDMDWLIQTKKGKKVKELSEEEKQYVANGYMYFDMHILPTDGFSEQGRKAFWYACKKLNFKTYMSVLSIGELSHIFPKLSEFELFNLLYESLSGMCYRRGRTTGSISFASSIGYLESDRVFEICFNRDLDEVAIENFIESYPQENFENGYLL